MIDPRALQQHFRQVQQNEQPTKVDVPRIPDLNPLTAVQAIPEPILEQEKIDIVSDVFNSLRDETTKTGIELIEEPVDLIIDIQEPIDAIHINEVEDPLISSNETLSSDSYDPYGYYSKF